ncbi:hypothetical protein B6U70_02725 [Euryarchaeota archaeon ex4484_162]|nr:MAG: hypothetical protein B6U70_02725 [Euryarchaeota archaeon ex4484_162]
MIKIFSKKEKTGLKYLWIEIFIYQNLYSPSARGIWSKLLFIHTPLQLSAPDPLLHLLRVLDVKGFPPV